MRDLVYRISRKFFLTADITGRIQGKIALMYPTDKYNIIKRTTNQLIKIYLSAIITLAFLMYFADISIYYFFTIAAALYVVVNSQVSSNLNRIETKLLKEFLKFIESVKFHFQYDGMIEESILNAVNDSQHQMALHGQIIYEYLMKNSMDDNEDYQDICPNGFFLTFYTLCQSVIKYGDKKLKDGSLFLKNLAYLKEDINIEILKRKSIENAFMGLFSITILPMFAIKPIELWAKANIIEMANIYEGIFGRLSTVVISAVTVIIYRIILNMKYPKTVKATKKQSIVKLASMECIKKMVTFYMNRFYKSVVKIEKNLKTIAYPYNIMEFCIYRFYRSIQAFIVSLVLGLSIGIGVYAILMGVLIFALTYIGILLSVNMKKSLIMLEREEEIVRFQTIILMLMYSDRITVEQILMQINRFSECFREQIEEIINKLSYKGISVFKSAKEKSMFLPFNRLMDGFIACDDMYIYKAFSDVETDRQYYINKQKQETGYYIEMKSSIGKFISFIPLCLVIIVKLIVPFVIVGMESLSMGGGGLL